MRLPWTGTITLLTGELLITDSLTITGPGANVLTISGNQASRVFHITAGTVSLFGLTIANGSVNEASPDGEHGGGIWNSGTLTVTSCTITGNMTNTTNVFRSPTGGGLANFGTATIINSTISANTAKHLTTGGFTGGGGISNFGPLTVTNSTISGNATSCAGIGLAFGGGIDNFDVAANLFVNITNSTITGNSASADFCGGGGINSDKLVNLKSTIVALNTVTGRRAEGPDLRTGGGQLNSQGYNLIGILDNTVVTIIPAPGTADQNGTLANPLNPLLGPLANNGGPTPTHALLPGSPALDKGMNTGLPTDQRGFARTVDSNAIANAAGGDGTDIGAFEFGAGAMLNVQAADPAVCLDPGGLVGVTATVTNPNGFGANANFTATLPAGLTAIAGSCNADVNPGGCTIAPNGGSVTWNGVLAAGQTVTIVYRARIGANVTQGTQLTINNTANVGGAGANFNAVLTVNCPAIVNTRVSDQKAGSVLVFPYYTSTVGGANDTRLTISNVGTGTGNSFVHVFLIDGASCQQSDLFLCLTPNASFSFKASDYDPGNTGYVIAVAVNAQGLPIQNNVLIGNAFVNTATVTGNYGAESFWANSALALATIDGGAATLYFDQVGYDAVPKQFAVEIQSPADAVGQQVVTAALSGSLVTAQVNGAAQVGVGQAYNEKEVFASFNAWLTGACQARATISATSPRVPNGLGNLIRTGQTGHLKFNVGGAVGVLLTPRAATWKGVRTLHKTQTTATTLTIPIFVPVC